MRYLNYTLEDVYRLRNPASGPCPQPERLRYFAYAMALVAGEVEARKFGLDQDPGKPQQTVRRGTEIRMPGGGMGFKPTER